MLSVADGSQKETLVAHVRPLLAVMRKSNSLYTKNLNSCELQLSEPFPSLTYATLSVEKLVGQTQPHSSS